MRIIIEMEGDEDEAAETERQQPGAMNASLSLLIHISMWWGCGGAMELWGCATTEQNRGEWERVVGSETESGREREKERVGG